MYSNEAKVAAEVIRGRLPPHIGGVVVRKRFFKTWCVVKLFISYTENYEGKFALY
jgi:hypothetical protein